MPKIEEIGIKYKLLLHCAEFLKHGTFDLFCLEMSDVH